jgi:peptidoglycan/xylan/chitin deacetylase (PgdA/CDA1 family)
VRKFRLSLAENHLTTILFHRFFFSGEDANVSRDRLKRQCEWLVKNFNLIRLSELDCGLTNKLLPSYPLLVTIDDAKIEVLHVLDIFKSFSIPVAIFACVGWCAQEETRIADPHILLARLVADIQWFRGPRTTIRVGEEILPIGDDTSAEDAIDKLLNYAAFNEIDPADLSPAVFETFRRKKVSCTLKELVEVQSHFVAIGGHSISHINLATASSVRLSFEISETRRILRDVFGECTSFAYPYGMPNTFNSATSRELAKAGFRSAFLSHSGFAGPDTDRLQIPRIALPDRALSQPEFRARVAGAGVVYRKIKQTFGRS